MIEYATIGEITVDDTVMETGEVQRGQTGGGTVYSALGVRLWGHQVAINSVVGHDYPEENLKTLRENRVAVEGIRRIEGWSLRLWLLHEENNKKQQFPKLQSSTFAQLDEARLDPPESYLSAKGFHIAPSTPEGQMRSRDFLRARQPNALISVDILTDPYVNYGLYRTAAAYQGVSIFSPSIVEIEALWPGESLEDSIKRIADFGVRWIAIKMDTRGSVVHDAAKGETYRVPIFPARTVDSTGAGDSYSGGFLEGIGETGDALEAGLRGTISASFCVEHWGAFDMMQFDRHQAEERLAWLKHHIEAL